MKCNAPPLNEQVLLERCQQIAGKSLAELASSYPEPSPSKLLHAKGWIGKLIEWHLGAPSLNSSGPDFINLGIELKTLPINAAGLPQESTFVCTAPWKEKPELQSWRSSRVWQKLQRVLWVPVEADPQKLLLERRVGNAILWQPDFEIEQQLQADWEELMNMLLLGHDDLLSAHFGTYLQIRPKALNSKIRRKVLHADGNTHLRVPKGFYLRSILTRKILEAHYCQRL